MNETIKIDWMDENPKKNIFLNKRICLVIPSSLVMYDAKNTFENPLSKTNQRYLGSLITLKTLFSFSMNRIHFAPQGVDKEKCLTLAENYGDFQ